MTIHDICKYMLRPCGLRCFGPRSVNITDMDRTICDRLSIGDLPRLVCEYREMSELLEQCMINL